MLSYGTVITTESNDLDGGHGILSASTEAHVEEGHVALKYVYIPYQVKACNSIKARTKISAPNTGNNSNFELYSYNNIIWIL
jgi:hypothetical protein